jgi:2-hydroxychromene-2-carboxylate isomerase
MPRTVEFFFDFMSPPSYMAYWRLPQIALRTGAQIIWRPLYTIGLHQLVGNQSPIMVPAKGAWIAKDLQRFAERHDIPYTANPHQPVKVVPALRGALAAQEMGVFPAYVRAVFTAMWQDKRNIGDPGELRSICRAAGVDADALLARIEAPEIKSRLVANTQEAADRGAFGAPSFFVDGELFWGQDRLDFVEEALVKP